MEYYDADGFELDFEYGTSPEERDYYAQQYTNVNLVANKKNHCTSCSIHIGTPPSAENNIQSHSVLRVTQCRKCYRFCNSGAFVKGEDGNELHCRWCGEGGELYCCSACPYVFCEKCIVRNLSADGLKQVLANDDWKCYACEPKVLYPLRAQHWALVNYIKKQKKSLESKIAKGLNDQDKIAFHMKKDSSVCCPSKTTAPKRKRRISTDDEDELWSEPVDSGNLPPSSLSSRSHLQRKKSRPYECPVSVKRNKAKPSRARTTASTSIVTAKSEKDVNVEPMPQIFSPQFSHYQVHSLEMNGALNGTTNSISDEQEMPPDTKPIQQLNTEVGRGRTQFRNQMLNAMEMCRLVDGKLTDLMNSTTYKTANSMNDIKGLYTCLSTLLTFTNGRVESLQEKCMDDMLQFGFENDGADAADESHQFIEENEIQIGDFSLKIVPEESAIEINAFGINNDIDNDEIEIIETKPTTIILDDSDEEPS